MPILTSLLSIIRKSTNLDEDKEDIYTLGKVDTQRKYQIEQSKAYVGYKLLWIIKSFLDGKGYPNGYLSQEKYRHHVCDIVEVISNQ
jgi:hypothetical protein